MNKKVTLPKEVTEAIEKLRSTGVSNFEILNKTFGAITSKPDLTLKRWAFDEQGGTVDLLMLALINGYKVEQTPEEKLRDYLNELYVIASNEDPGTRRQYQAESQFEAVQKTIDLLGITIAGINDDGCGAQ